MKTKLSEDNSYIQQTIHQLLRKEAFLGGILQELSIKINNTEVPTMALKYDKKTCNFSVEVNDQFLRSLAPEQRVAVLIHELMHFTNGHVWRWEELETVKDQALRNIAGDMAINQFIDDLPEGTVNVEDYKNEDGTPFPKYKTMENYFSLLKATTEPPPEDEAGDLPGSSINYERYKKYQPFDEHDWENLSDEDKEQMLQQAKKLVKRTMDKLYHDHSTAPNSVKDFLEDIETRLRELNYKGMLRYAIRRSLASSDRMHSYNRPSKRYGVYAPGTVNEKLPTLSMYIDMSGSISIKEANMFLACVNGFLGAGDYKKCKIGFWHTELYRFRDYRKNTELKEEDMGSGGTEPLCVLEHIKETNPDLSIILTDGCYGAHDIKVPQKVIWMISEDGNMYHPYKHLGLTIKLSRVL